MANSVLQDTVGAFLPSLALGWRQNPYIDNQGPGSKHWSSRYVSHISLVWLEGHHWLTWNHTTAYIRYIYIYIYTYQCIYIYVYYYNILSITQWPARKPERFRNIIGFYLPNRMPISFIPVIPCQTMQPRSRSKKVETNQLKAAQLIWTDPINRVLARGTLLQSYISFCVLLRITPAPK